MSGFVRGFVLAVLLRVLGNGVSGFARASRVLGCLGIVGGCSVAWGKEVGLFGSLTGRGGLFFGMAYVLFSCFVMPENKLFIWLCNAAGAILGVCFYWWCVCPSVVRIERCGAICCVGLRV